ncbi:hypothetical protein SAMN05216570_3848 [Dyella sp. OK004]|uniref:hypothetical protein n=1 Tax=Dyella sp. OK004 TaxID=1855292 RepID=UPI0008DEE929|nr:hypothetical protein [Dyella sp. OK004]SFS18908.1 hypothetical protein SAMN05216570_3848 [Dyella sp. OK004]
MAKPNHTAPARPSGSPDNKPTNPLSRPFYLDTTDDPGQHVLVKLAGIAMAINVITGLLANSDAFRDAQAHDEPTDPGHWPLAPGCTEGLFAAVYFLNQYAETLSHDSLIGAEGR